MLNNFQIGILLNLSISLQTTGIVYNVTCTLMPTITTFQTGNIQAFAYMIQSSISKTIESQSNKFTNSIISTLPIRQTHPHPP